MMRTQMTMTPVTRSVHTGPGQWSTQTTMQPTYHRVSGRSSMRRPADFNRPTANAPLEGTGLGALIMLGVVLQLLGVPVLETIASLFQ
ncbi:hypothetical protein GCM10029964_089230 [Kibdelosporangium lantanae]